MHDVLLLQLLLLLLPAYTEGTYGSRKVASAVVEYSLMISYVVRPASHRQSRREDTPHASQWRRVGIREAYKLAAVRCHLLRQ